MAKAKIKDLKYDDRNFNRHTPYGMELLEKSIKKFGLGRSILIDKDNNIIAGNGVTERMAGGGKVSNSLPPALFEQKKTTKERIWAKNN